MDMNEKDSSGDLGVNPSGGFLFLNSLPTHA